MCIVTVHYILSLLFWMSMSDHCHRELKFKFKSISSEQRNLGMNVRFMTSLVFIYLQILRDTVVTVSRVIVKTQIFVYS